MSWESSAQAGRLVFWGARAELGARFGRPWAGWRPQSFYCWPSLFGGFGWGVPLFIVMLVIY